MNKRSHSEHPPEPQPVVTPSPKKRRDLRSSICESEAHPSAKRGIKFEIEEQLHDDNKTIAPCSNDDDSRSLPSTQEPSYKPNCAAGLPERAEDGFGILEDVYNPASSPICVSQQCFTLGRDPSCDMVIHNSYVSRKKHCELAFEGDGTCTFTAVKKCWVSSRCEGRWDEVEPDRHISLFSGQHFRVQAPSDQNSAKGSQQEFRIRIFVDVPRQRPMPGSHSFDSQYLFLLKAIATEGESQNNKKGSNVTLRRSFTLSIDLSNTDDRYILPLTTLRSLYGGRAAVIEAIWYLRGEDNIRFLQEFKCRFWDKQCSADGWLGLNYGLLTNFPQADSSTSSVNQLETEVIARLCSGTTSRNMVCSLLKPGEPTGQVACTTSIQFSVSVNEDNEETLDMTVNQRSSDVIVGLPHDVVVWAIVLHLVRREVKIRTKGKRQLAAGYLVFSIAAGGAHVYDLNSKAFKELRTRQPNLESQPYLKIQNKESNTDLPQPNDQKGLFILANDFHEENFHVCGYTQFNKAIRVRQAI